MQALICLTRISTMKVESTKFAQPIESQWPRLWELCLVEINQNFLFKPQLLKPTVNLCLSLDNIMP